MTRFVKSCLQPSRASARALFRARSESGFTLIEMLVAVAILVIVLGALMAPLVFSQTVQTRDANYAYAQQEARTGLDGMVSQIRQATAILGSGPYKIEMNVSLNGTALHVQYECDIQQPGTSYQECVRVQAPLGSALPSLSSGTVVLTHLLNGAAPVTPVFTFGPDPVAPYYMTATIKVPASGGAAYPAGLRHTIVFTDGALMRNLNIGN